MLNLRIPLPVFRNAKEIVNGKNARMALKGLVANRVLVVTGKSFASSVHCEQISRLVNAESVKFVTKSWLGEPSLSSLSDLIHELEDYRPDYIIALGGGSVIDGTKLAWVFYEHPVINPKDIFRPFSMPALRGKAKFAAIPTTVGSGSEVSSAAVLFDPVSGSKKAVVSHDLLPDLVILDPLLIAEVSPSILRLTIADALSHAIEGYLSTIDHPLMDVFAEKAVQIIFGYRDKLKDDVWSAHMLEDLQYASMLAGWVQNHCLVGISHAIAHQLGSFKVGHALANGLLMPEVIDFNCSDDQTKARYQHLCLQAGISDIDAMKGLFYELVADMKPSLQLSQNQLSVIAESSLHDPAARVCPVSFDENDVFNIVKKSLL